MMMPESTILIKAFTVNTTSTFQSRHTPENMCWDYTCWDALFQVLSVCGVNMSHKMWPSYFCRHMDRLWWM